MLNLSFLSRVPRDTMLRHAWAQGMTPRNAVRAVAIGRRAPDGVVLNDYALDFILWERTAFPVCDLEYTLRQADAYLSAPEAVEAELAASA